MALTRAQSDFVNRAQNLSRLFKEQYGEIVALNALWNGAVANFNDTITDGDLALVFPGLTVATLNEILYIDAQLKTLLDDRLEQVAVMTA